MYKSLLYKPFQSEVSSEGDLSFKCFFYSNVEERCTYMNSAEYKATITMTVDTMVALKTSRGCTEASFHSNQKRLEELE